MDKTIITKAILWDIRERQGLLRSAITKAANAGSMPIKATHIATASSYFAEIKQLLARLPQ